MKVGLYSFERMELAQINKLLKKINERLRVDKIYLYSENTCKERYSQREGFKKMLEDYQNKKIDIIAVENLNSFGKDGNVKLQILKELQARRNKLIFITEPVALEFMEELFIDITINYLESCKQLGDERSKVGARFSKSKKVEVIKKNGRVIITKDKKRMKRCIEKNLL